MGDPKVVRVGKVDSVELDGAKVMVTFRVKDAWVGDRWDDTKDLASDGWNEVKSWF